MPGHPDCPLPCPWRDDPVTACAAVRLGHDAFCRSAHPGMPGSVRRITMEMDGRWVEPEPDPEPELPPLAEQLGNYARSTASHVLAGFPKADPATRAARLAACHGCDRYRPSDDRCSACGCPALRKAVRLLEACPLGRWPA